MRNITFMFTFISKQLQIFNSIILFIFDRTKRIFNSFMVNNFFSCKIPSKMLLHNKTMLLNIAMIIAKRMAGYINYNVSFTSGMSTSFLTTAISSFISKSYFPFSFFRMFSSFFHNIFLKVKAVFRYLKRNSYVSYLTNRQFLDIKNLLLFRQVNCNIGGM